MTVSSGRLHSKEPDYRDPAPRTYAPGVSLLDRVTFELDKDVSRSPDDIEDWLLGAASKTASAIQLIDGFASRLAQAGLGVWRLSLNVGTLHPQAYGYAWNWNALDGLCDEIQVGEETLFSKEFRKNPVCHVVEFGETVRIRLEPETAEAQGPLMGELAAAGFTEYIALPLSSSGEKFNAVTLATQETGGFTETQLQTVLRLLDIFALQVERHITRRIAENISRTYLGRAAGEHVVSGSIKRGAGLAIEAIVWSSDMRNFSSLTEDMQSEAVAGMLNNYFSILAESVMRHGGDVLKFVGDGMLAVFPLTEFQTAQEAAEAAARAAREAVEALEALNLEKAEITTWKPLRTGIGLHVGEVFFGNIGAARRLDFTVIGEAVNIASRIEGLCKPLQRSVLLSSSVAALLQEGTENLGPQEMKGMQRTEEISALVF